MQTEIYHDKCQFAARALEQKEKKGPGGTNNPRIMTSTVILTCITIFSIVLMAAVFWEAHQKSKEKHRRKVLRYRFFRR